MKNKTSGIHILGLLAAFGLLAGCQPCVTEAPMTDGDWILVQLNGTPVEVAAVEGLQQPTLTLDSETGQASGSSGVNRYTTSFTGEGSTFSFGVVAGTRMMGPPAAQAVEDAFLAMLEKVDACAVVDGQLQLLGQGTILARFEPM